MPTIIKENYKKILLTISLICAIPLISVIINVIYTYGAYVGTQARTIIETGICK